MKKIENNQSITETADQLVRHYQVSYNSEREEVLDTILSKIESENKEPNTKTRTISWYKVAGISVAASVLIAVAFYFFTAIINVTAPGSGTLAYNLPDNSRVVLQENSEITFKKYYWNRKIKLGGEAYFEVEKGNRFRVKTKLGEVTVLGTRFVVKDTKELLEVTCFEGSVKTSVGKTEKILQPGTRVTASNEKMDLQNISAEKKYPEFAKFSKVYSKKDLAEVADELETFFGKEIIVKTNTTRKFSGTIQTANLESALEILCGSMQLNYKKTTHNTIILQTKKTQK